MNWTGGQLHRSARQGTLSKHQRQNFAKSRLVAVDRASRHFSPFPGFPGPSNARHEQSAACKEGQDDVATAGNSQTPASIPPRLPGASSVTGGTRLDSLKRQLLQDPDWAAVSAARPLEMAFTPAEEIERFGKRRKLNDHDRQRLSAANGHSYLSGPATLYRNGRDSFPGDVCLDQIKIRIDGRPAGLHSSHQGKSASVFSSQSMLLDHETSLISQPSGRETDSLEPEHARVAKSGRVSLQPSYSQPLLEKFLSDNRHPAASGDTELFDNVIPESPEDEDFPPNSPLPRSQAKPDRIEWQSLIGADQPLQPRRFTIDDQVLAERTEHTFALHRHELSYSPAETLVASPMSSNTDALSHQESFSWLPQPRHPNDSRSPRLVCVHAANHPESIANQSPYLNSSIDPVRDVGKADSPSETVRLFGQLVRNDDVVENV